MDRRKLEAVAEAIVRTSGYLNADTPIYTGRNPGGLLAFSPRHARDEQGFRVFPSVMNGMEALFFDVALKLEGKSRAHLAATDTLSDFAEACGLNRAAAVNWSAFLRKALHDPALSQKTEISYFLEK